MRSTSWKKHAAPLGHRAHARSTASTNSNLPAGVKTLRQRPGPAPDRSSDPLFGSRSLIGLRRTGPSPVRALVLFGMVIACVDARSAARADDTPWNALLGPV